MSYLLDKNVISELAKLRKNAGVLDWLAAHRGAQLFISVLTLGELLRGVARLRDRGDLHQADAVGAFVRETEERYASRVLPVSSEVVRAWARQPSGRPVPVVDALIAATATVHDLVVVTRNSADFEPTAVRVLNPFSTPS